MNYITEIKSFQEFVQDKSLSAGQIALWYTLMYINNRCQWSEWFTVANLSLESNSGLSKSGILKNRNILKQYGLIDFKANGTKATSYKLIQLTESNRDSERNSVPNSNRSSTPNSERNSKTLINQTKPNKEKDKSQKKIAFGEFKNVLLEESQVDTLIARLGDVGFENHVESLSGWLANGHKAKNHYATILNWWRRAGQPVVGKQTKANLTIVDDDDIEINENMTADAMFG